MEIIRAKTAHIDLIRELTMQVWPQTYTPIVGKEQVDYMLNRFYTYEAMENQMTALNHQFIVGYSEGKPVAFASFSEVIPGIFKLHKLYIVTGMQGRGIGRAMVDFITASLIEKNASSLQLNVNIYNKAAMSFYEKYGFRHLLDEDIDIGNGYFMNDHVLSLNLKESDNEVQKR